MYEIEKLISHDKPNAVIDGGQIYLNDTTAFKWYSSSYGCPKMKTLIGVIFETSQTRTRTLNNSMFISSYIGNERGVSNFCFDDIMFVNCIFTGKLTNVSFSDCLFDGCTFGDAVENINLETHKVYFGHCAFIDSNLYALFTETDFVNCMFTENEDILEGGFHRFNAINGIGRENRSVVYDLVQDKVWAGCWRADGHGRGGTLDEFTDRVLNQYGEDAYTTCDDAIYLSCYQAAIAYFKALRTAYKNSYLQKETD
jgi:hypothetical protein